MDRSLYQAVRPSLTLFSDHMLRHKRGWFAHIVLLLSDATIVFLAFVLAYWMRYIANWPSVLEPIVSEVTIQNFVDFHAFVPVTMLLMIVLAILFETKGLYRLAPGSGFLEHASIIMSSTLTGIALLIVIVFLYRPFFYSRLIFAFAGLNIVVLLLLWRGALVAVCHWGWSRGIGREPVLVVGGNGLAQQVMQSISTQPELGYRLIGYLNDHPKSTSGITAPHLGDIQNLKNEIVAHNVHYVILALPFWEHGRLPQLVQTCRALDVEFHIVPDLYELSFDRVDVLQLSGVPLIGLKELSIKGWNLALKRGLDIALILFTLPITLPLMLFIALIIRLDSPGPWLFRQKRVGKGGRYFTCYKFRTMVQDAEDRKAELIAFNEADGPLFKIRRDPRITRVGSLLRRYSLDELPQFWNVLRGDMSLVGPRPAVPQEVEQYTPLHHRRLEVTPGLTGLWQVLGRSDTSFDDMVRLDIYYAENWSVGMDVRILLKTIPVVVLGKGAY